MRIEDIMTTPAITCGQNESLNTPARLMWENDCGAIPLTGEDGRITGIVTDRDICMAAYIQGRTLEAIATADIMTRQVFSCRPGDRVDTAERLMREQQVRRIPVVDDDGCPVGVLSMNDIARAAAGEKKDGFDREAIETLAAISQPRLPQLDERRHEAATA